MVNNFAPKTKVFEISCDGDPNRSEEFYPIRHQQSSSHWDENGAPNIQVCYGGRPYFSANFSRDNALDA